MTRIRFDGCDLSPRGAPRSAEASSPAWRAPASSSRKRSSPARSLPTAGTSRLPRPHRAVAARARSARRGGGRGRGALRPPARGLGGRGARRASADRDRDRVREDARFQPARARRPRANATPPGALPLSDQGARPRPVPDVERARDPAAPAGDLRRRHAHRPSLADPQVGERRAGPTPTWCTSACCPTTSAGATCSPTSATSSVDEAHVYRGVFGSHVANVLRRLRRIARLYGSESSVPARDGNDRQSCRARCGAARNGGDA